MPSLSELLETRDVLLADGATGTTLFDMGLTSGDAPELWNVDFPERIASLHQGYVDAGADIILTNSFGGTRHRLKLHNAHDRVFALNKAAAEIARDVVDRSGRAVVVAGSIGPTGELLIPLGALTYQAAVDAFVEQAEGLKAGGADVLWIETMSAVDEIKAAVEAAGEVDMPYVYTASFDTAGRTMMGLLPQDLPSVTGTADALFTAVGANCGVGATDLLASILALTEAHPDLTVVAKANAGIPVVHGEHVHYSGTPDLMADYARIAADCGARIIGGCCGSSKEHIAAMRAALDGYRRGERPSLEAIIERIGPLTNAAPQHAQPVRDRSNTRRRRRAA